MYEGWTKETNTLIESLRYIEIIGPKLKCNDSSSS